MTYGLRYENQYAKKMYSRFSEIGIQWNYNMYDIGSVYVITMET